MNLIKRIKGDLRFESLKVDPDDVSPEPLLHDMTIETNELTILGDLTVTGTTTTVNSEETLILDPILTLNSGELGAGVTLDYSGIEIDRGSSLDVALRYNDISDRWEATDDGTSFYALAPDLSSFDLVNDLTPQLGGDLDVNGFTITSASNGDVVLDADGTGLIKFDQEITIQEQLSAPGTTVGYNKLYAKLPEEGGSGLFVKNATINDELITREKALIYALFF